MCNKCNRSKPSDNGLDKIVYHFNNGYRVIIEPMETPGEWMYEVYDKKKWDACTSWGFKSVQEAIDHAVQRLPIKL